MFLFLIETSLYSGRKTSLKKKNRLGLPDKFPWVDETQVTEHKVMVTDCVKRI